MPQPNCHQFGWEDYLLTLDSFLTYRVSAVVSCYEVMPVDTIGRRIALGSTMANRANGGLNWLQEMFVGQMAALEVLAEHLETRIVCGGLRYGAGSLFEIRDGKDFLLTAASVEMTAKAIIDAIAEYYPRSQEVSSFSSVRGQGGDPQTHLKSHREHLALKEVPGSPKRRWNNSGFLRFILPVEFCG